MRGAKSADRDTGRDDGS